MSRFLLGAAGRGKSPPAPQAPQPWGRGEEAVQKGKRVLIHKHKLTDTDTHRHINEQPSSSDKPHAPKSQERSQRGQHGRGRGRSVPPRSTQAPRRPAPAVSGASSGAGSSPARTSGRPMLNLQPARGRLLRRPRWLCSRGSCLSAPPYRRRSARARRLPDPSLRPRLPPRRPAGFSGGVPRSWSRRC